MMHIFLRIKESELNAIDIQLQKVDFSVKENKEIGLIRHKRYFSEF